MAEDHDLLVRIDERVKAIDEKVDEIVTEVKGVSARVDTLENWRARLTGQVTILSGSVAVVVTVISIMVQTLKV